MIKSRDVSQCDKCLGWLDIKTLLIAILFLGTILLGLEILIRYIYIRPTCSLAQLDRERDNLNILISNHELPNQPGSRLGKRENTSTEKSDDKRRWQLEKAEDSLHVIKRDFRALGSAASVFVEFGAYRGGDESFAVVGLGSKPLHVYGNAAFGCEWESNSGRSPRVKGTAQKFLPDWGYGRVYTVVVVNCSFPNAVGINGEGGKLIVHATSDGVASATFVALEETPAMFSAASAQYNRNRNESKKYDFMYCGSSLFGDINPHRIREWLAYHIKLMGPKSHFIFHDAGGIGLGVREALRPWQRKGYITLYDIKDQANYDGYYYNQFLVVNDCLHHTRYLANWTFFFDVDEYLYVPPYTTLHDTMDAFSNYTQITFEQSPMSSKLCQAIQKNASFGNLWGFERLVYRNVKKRFRWDRKYAIQARNVFATGVHMSENIVGKTLHTKGSSIKYYHYHNTITTKESDMCKELVNSTSAKLVVNSDKDPFIIDLGLQYMGQSVKDFESQQIGGQSTSSFL